MRRQLPLPREFWEQIPPPVQAVLGMLIESYERRMARLEGEVAALKEQLRQNSQNSSRPPSTDGSQGKRRPPPEPSGRKRGAQPGHTRYERTVGPLAQVKEGFPCKPLWCRRCGSALQGSDAQPLRHQGFEVQPVAVEVREYQLHRLSWEQCGQTTCGT